MFTHVRHTRIRVFANLDNLGNNLTVCQELNDAPSCGKAKKL